MNEQEILQAGLDINEFLISIGIILEQDEFEDLVTHLQEYVLNPFLDVQRSREYN